MSAMSMSTMSTTPQAEYRRSVTTRDWRPRYVQVAEDLEGRIRSGDLLPDAPLPSEPDLADAYGLSRTSVRNAIRLLRAQGIVRVERGRGTFVRTLPQKITRNASERYRAEKERALVVDETERGSVGASEMDSGLTFPDLRFEAEYDVIDAPGEIARLLDVPAGTRVLRRAFASFKLDGGEQVQSSCSYIPHELVKDHPELMDSAREPWPGGTMHQLRTIGVEVMSITDRITTRVPTVEEAEDLQIDDGIPVFVLWKVSQDQSGRIVEIAEVVLPGDRTELTYTTELDPWS